MPAEITDRAMDQRPMAANPMRQQRGIFIFRGHDHAIALEVREIFRECQSHARTATGVGRVDDGILGVAVLVKLNISLDT